MFSILRPGPVGGVAAASGGGGATGRTLLFSEKTTTAKTTQICGGLSLNDYAYYDVYFAIQIGGNSVFSLLFNNETAVDANASVILLGVLGATSFVQNAGGVTNFGNLALTAGYTIVKGSVTAIKSGANTRFHFVGETTAHQPAVNGMVCTTQIFSKASPALSDITTLKILTSGTNCIAADSEFYVWGIK